MALATIHASTACEKSCNDSLTVFSLSLKDDVKQDEYQMPPEKMASQKNTTHILQPRYTCALLDAHSLFFLVTLHVDLTFNVFSLSVAEIALAAA